MAWGAFAGALGQAAFSSAGMEWLSWLATIAMAAAFVHNGHECLAWQSATYTSDPLGRTLLPLPNQRTDTRRFGCFISVSPLRMASELCGVASAATRSPLLGAAFMAAFWLGTVPALSAAPWLVRRALRPFSVRAPKLSAILLMLVGLAGLGLKITPWLAGGGVQQASCPLHRSIGSK